MTICSACSRTLPPHARFCDRCGAVLTPRDATQLQARNWLVGTAPECDLVVKDLSVSAWHCLLTEVADGLLLEDLGSTNGTFVNGHQIAGRVRVTRSDTVTLGQAVPMPWPSVDSANGASVIRIGRAPKNEVVLDYPMISGHHARIIVASCGAARLEDLGSTNGTAIGSPERRILRSPLSRSDTVYFGSFHIPAARLLHGQLALGFTPHDTISFSGQVMTLGRDPSCDEVLDYPMVSWRHARLARTGSAMTVEDLGSTNGTFVNGGRVTGVVAVQAGDVIGLGNYTFRLTATGNLEKRDYYGNLTVEAMGVTVEVPGKRLLEDVSLTIYPSELVGLMGPSGAGKTTLMNALNGYVPPTSGAVLYNGQDLYALYDQFRGQLGYVPQDDIMHRDLTVSQALYYTARLRLPADYSDTDIHTRIKHVLEQLGLEGVADVLIGSPEKKGISGGQRKRVNLAMELLTDPSVLFLDEPTSGLSSEDALMVMHVLRQLTDTGKTILITIHQPSLEVFRLLDSLVVISKDRSSPDPGQMVYFGPAYPDAVYFFNRDHRADNAAGVQQPTPSPDEVLRGLAKSSTQEWAGQYAASTYKCQYVDARSGQQPASVVAPVTPTIARHAGWLQWWTLVRRCCTIKMKDTWMTAILLAQAPLIALLTVLVFAHKLRLEVTPKTWFEVKAKLGVTIFMLVLATLWFGCSNAVREIIGERAIYHRERMVNLKIPSYLASKFTVLGCLCLMQCMVLLSIVHVGCRLQGPWLPMFGVLVLASFVGVGLGLMASALARTSEVAIALLPVILLPMILLGGVFMPKHEMTLPVLSDVMPTWWAYEGALLLETAQGRRPLSTTEEDMAESLFPKANRGSATQSMLVLSGMLAILVMGILGILKLRDVHRSRVFTTPYARRQHRQ